MSICPTSVAKPGFTAIEFIIAAIPILLLSLSAYEVSAWYQHRHMLNLAMLEAARQGSVQHAHPQAIQDAFEAAITPLFVPTGAYSDANARRDAYFNSIQAQAGASWRVLIEDPNPKHYQDFKRPDLAIALSTGFDTIDNNFQKEQHLRKPQGLLSAQTIYQANTLTLSIVYPYKPKVPGISALFRQLSRFQSDEFAASLMRQAGVLPIRHRLAISMQSHPVMWSQHQAQHVTYAHQINTPVPLIPGHSQGQAKNHACVGLWCDPSYKAEGSHESGASNPKKPDTYPNTHPKSGSQTNSQTRPATHPTSAQTDSAPGSTTTDNHSAEQGPNSNSSNQNHLPPTEQDASSQNNMSEPANYSNDEKLCGVSLCC